MENKEKRQHKRYASQASIMYSDYFENPYCYYGAEMLNYSMGGMYLVSQYELKPGLIVNLRKAVYGIDSLSPQTDENKWGRIVWGTKLETIDKFGYGISTRDIDTTGLSSY